MIPLLNTDTIPIGFRSKSGGNAVESDRVELYAAYDQIEEAIDLAMVTLSERLDAAGCALAIGLEIHIDLFVDPSDRQRCWLRASAVGIRGTWDLPPAHESLGSATSGDTARCGVGGRGSEAS